tara:strand:+ start:327 stop:749 length:423 start_codon:yes stop_codon:yes gene_type:complete
MGKRGKFKMTNRAHNHCADVKVLLKLIDTRRRFWQLTGQDLADLCGMGQPAVQQALTGKAACSFRRAVHIANALGIEVTIKTKLQAMPVSVKKIKRFNETKIKQARARSDISKAARQGEKIMSEIEQLPEIDEYKEEGAK